MKINVKDKLMKTTVDLLKGGASADSLTAREIATAANVNLAMINYYYKSKDELLYLSVSELMREEVNVWFANKDESISAYDKLRTMLINVCDITVQYSAFTRLTVEYEVIKADITAPQYMIPLIREICEEERTELSVRIIAYEIISFLQLVYLRAKEFWAYAGVDVLDSNSRIQVIDTLLSSHFPNRGKRE